MVFPKNLNLGVTFNLCAAILAFLAALKALGAFLPTVKPAPTALAALAPLTALAVEANFATLPSFPAPGIGTARVVPTWVTPLTNPHHQVFVSKGFSSSTNQSSHSGL